MPTEGGTIELVFRAKLDRLERDLAEGKTKAAKAGADMGEELESKLGAKLGGGGIGKSLKKGMVAGATAAGVAGGAAASVGFMGALESGQANANLAASLGLNDEEAKAAGANAGALYADNFGASVGAAGDAIAAVFQGGLVGVDDADADIQRITGKMMTLAEVFRLDMSESVTAVSALLTNKLVPDADTAMDQLTATMQQVPEILRGEILSALTEYSPFFAQLGITSEKAMASLITASAGGTIAIDKTGDALKELVIRAQDGSKLTSEALTGLGLDAAKIGPMFAAGGDKANDALQWIIENLLAVGDPLKQTQIGVALLGTPFEDLGQNAIPTLQALGTGLGEVNGKAQEMVDTVGGTGAAKLETFKRSMETNVNKTMETAVGWLDKLPGPVQTGIASFAGFMPMLAPLSPIVGALIPLLFGQAAGHTAAGTAAAASSVGFFAAAAGVWAVMAPILLITLAIAALIAIGVLLYKNWDTILGVGKRVFGWIAGAWDGLVAGFKIAWNWIASRINGIGFSIPDWVPIIGGKRFDMPNLPILDNGGIVSQPTLALLAANSRPEAVVPLDRMGSVGGGGDGGGGGNVYVAGSIITERELMEKVRSHLGTFGFRTSTG